MEVSTSEAEPLVNLMELKEFRKALRAGSLNADEIDDLYRRVQATPEKYYYSEQKTKEWRIVMEYLMGDFHDGTPLFAGVLRQLIRRFLDNPATVERGLGLLASLARMSGHINMNLVDVYRKLADRFGFELIVTPGAEQFAGAEQVPHSTFTVGVTNDRAIRVRLTTEQAGAGSKASLQSILDRAYAPMKAPRRKAAPMSHRGASANQTSYALSGRPPPLPGTHEMSDGTIMAD